MHLKLSGVHLHYGDHKEALRGIDFEDEVSTLALIGHSGCGKTSLLRVLAGLLVPQEGQVLVDGLALPREEQGLLAYRRTIGIVFQQGGLFSHMDARTNIARPLHLVHGYSKKDSLDRADDLLARFGLYEHGHKLPRELSGGQYQRIAIARAIAPRARLLLLDEPTSALDPAYTGEVLRMVEELKESGTHFIIVTHELSFAARACDKVMLMEDGKIAEYGSSGQIFSQPRTAALQAFLAESLPWAPLAMQARSGLS